jgi:hypothetical protein
MCADEVPGLPRKGAMRRGTVFGLLAVVLAVAPARGAFDCYVRVAQPHDQPEAGEIGLMYVTYELMLGSAVPGIEIRYTCAPGPVALDRGGGYRGVENRNGANKLGFRITVEDFADPSLWKGQAAARYVDTMTVTLDVRAAARRLGAKRAGSPSRLAQATEDEFDETVRCAVDCILDNATRSAPPIRHLHLEVLGPRKFRALSRVYRVKQPQQQ